MESMSEDSMEKYSSEEGNTNNRGAAMKLGGTGQRAVYDMHPVTFIITFFPKRRSHAPTDLSRYDTLA